MRYKHFFPDFQISKSLVHQGKTIFFPKNYRGVLKHENNLFLTHLIFFIFPICLFSRNCWGSFGRCTVHGGRRTQRHRNSPLEQRTNNSIFLHDIYNYIQRDMYCGTINEYY